MPIVEERVDRLEEALTTFIRHVGIEFNKTYNAIQELHIEMRVSREAAERDTKAFREATEKDTKAFKEEMRVSREATERDTKAFREATEKDTKVFKEEMRAFGDRMAKRSKEMDRKWGELANKMGTLAEDIIAPSMPRIFKDIFKEEIRDFAVRRRIRKDDRTYEFDIYVEGERIIFLVEVKSQLRSEDIKRAVETTKRFKEDLGIKKNIAISLATFYIDNSVIKACNKKGILAIGTSEGFAEILNSEGFKPSFI